MFNVVRSRARTVPSDSKTVSSGTTIIHSCADTVSYSILTVQSGPLTVPLVQYLSSRFQSQCISSTTDKFSSVYCIFWLILTSSSHPAVHSRTIIVRFGWNSLHYQQSEPYRSELMRRKRSWRDDNIHEWVPCETKFHNGKPRENVT